MAQQPPISANSSSLTGDLTGTSQSPSTESDSSFTSISETSDDSYVGVDPPTITKPTQPPAATMETTSLVRHSEYYMQDGMVEFQVQNIVYRVPAYVFTRDSDFFRDLLRGPFSSEEDMRKPIDLSDDVKSVDFERLLSILFPPVFGQYSATTCDEWTSILHLASKWGFTAVRGLAIREVFPLATPVERIALGRKYDLDDWLIDAFSAVCERPDALSLNEASRMSLEDVVRIAEAREAIRRPATLVEADTVKATISRMFGMSGFSDHTPREGTDSTPGGSTPCVSKGTKRAGPLQGDSPAHPSMAPATSSPTASAEEFPELLQYDSTPMKEELVLPIVMDDSLVQIARLLPEYHEWIRLGYTSSSTVPKDQIIKCLYSSDKQAITLKRLLELTIGEGIKWSARPDWGTAKGIADICKALPSCISDDFQATLNGQLLIGGQLASYYLREQCEVFIEDWGKPGAGWAAATADSILSRQIQVTTFIGYLYESSTLTEELVSRCCEKLMHLPAKPSIAAVQNLDKLLRRVGKVLDTPQSKDRIDAIFLRLCLLRLDWTYSRVHSMITELVALRKGGWR